MAASLQIRVGVRSLRDDDGTVIFDADRGTYFGLNVAAADIWTQLEAGSPLPDIERQLCQAYLLPLEVVRSTLAAFVAELKERRLVDWRE